MAARRVRGKRILARLRQEQAPLLLDHLLERCDERARTHAVSGESCDERARTYAVSRLWRPSSVRAESGVPLASVRVLRSPLIVGKLNARSVASTMPMVRART